jgi:hypothetical protein
MKKSVQFMIEIFIHPCTKSKALGYVLDCGPNYGLEWFLTSKIPYVFWTKIYIIEKKSISH